MIIPLVSLIMATVILIINFIILKRKYKKLLIKIKTLKKSFEQECLKNKVLSNKISEIRKDLMIAHGEQLLCKALLKKEKDE